MHVLRNVVEKWPPHVACAINEPTAAPATVMPLGLARRIARQIGEAPRSYSDTFVSGGSALSVGRMLNMVS